MADQPTIRYGTKEHEEFAELVEQVQNRVDRNFAAEFSKDPASAQRMESTKPVRELRRQIKEFQGLCNSRNEPLQEEYQNGARVLADRFQTLDVEGYLELNSSGKRILQQVLGSK